MAEQSRDRRVVDAAGRSGAPLLVARRAAARAHEIVDQRVGRTGVAGDRVRAINKRDIRDAAEIEHRDRVRPFERRRERLMIDRNQRRPLPARRNVGGAEIKNHRDADLARERRAVAELDGQTLLRPVQDGLAMKPHHVDAAAVDSVGLEEHLDGRGMQQRHDPLGLRDHAGALVAHAQRGRRLHRPAQHAFVIFIVGMNRARPETRDLRAVRLDQGDVDAVHRGAAHQPDRPHCAP
jgi:hypothetical protein